jgi:hypothetical protein
MDLLRTLVCAIFTEIVLESCYRKLTENSNCYTHVLSFRSNIYFPGWILGQNLMPPKSQNASDKSKNAKGNEKDEKQKKGENKEDKLKDDKKVRMLHS